MGFEGVNWVYTYLLAAIAVKGVEQKERQPVPLFIKQRHYEACQNLEYPSEYGMYHISRLSS